MFFKYQVIFVYVLFGNVIFKICFVFCSVSVDGRIYVWRIDEGPDEENKPQITGKIEIAIQIVGDAETYHPRICWHSHKQVMFLLHNG